MIGVQTGARLTVHADMGRLFRDWLAGNEVLGAAGADLHRFVAAATTPAGSGPIWAADEWRQAWLQGFLPDLASDADRKQARLDVEQLAAGQADAVITGQQPGFLGGPLHTLYKIAAAVILAELRTAAGRPTIPVFWSGDDDDDLREALQPVIWDPDRDILLQHGDHGRRGLSSDRMVGDLPAAEIADGAAHWLAQMSDRNELARDLAMIWRDGIASGDTWSRLQRRALLRVFREHRLLVISGNDPLLHAAAGPFYSRLWQERSRLRDAVRSGARQLVAAGYETAVTEPSIQRFLHLGREGRRQPLAAEYAGRLPEPADLRPGVVARSPVQDWLFRPAGVVVGPGEAAYLKQLEPLYAAFDLPRAPLLPRLFAQLGPAGQGAFRFWALDLAERESPEDSVELNAAAQRVTALARNELLAVLRGPGGVQAARLEELTSQVLRRWARYLTGVLQREQRRRRDEPGAGQPAWLRPNGRRQERALAAFGAAALWGDELIAALAHACRRYVDGGLDGDWREYLVTVPLP